MINVKQFAKFVVDLGDQVAPTDIEEGMRVGYDSFIHVVSCIDYSLLVPVFSLSPSLSYYVAVIDQFSRLYSTV